MASDMAPTGSTSPSPDRNDGGDLLLDAASSPVPGELALVAARLLDATSPLAVFGALDGAAASSTSRSAASSLATQLAQVRRAYRQLALSVHPDRHQNDPLAQRAFAALHQHYLLAQEQLRHGRYGLPEPPAAKTASAPVTLTTRRRTYVVGGPLAEGDLSVLYACTATDRSGRARGVSRGAVLKVARDGRDNDLLANEAATLRLLAMPNNSTPAPPYIPRLLEEFVYRDGRSAARQATVFPLVETERGPLPADGWRTLREVREAYPTGVDPRAMAWIWRRLLLALGHAHSREVVHGGVLPTHVLIHPEAHGLLLVDWCASVREPGWPIHHIPLVSAEYEAWYPDAVLAKRTPAPTIDLEMALRCMVDLLGGDALTGALPPAVPAPLQGYLQAALGASIRANDDRPGRPAGRNGSGSPTQPTAQTLYRDFSSLLAALWGKRAFVPFTMPARA